MTPRIAAKGIPRMRAAAAGVPDGFTLVELIVVLGVMSILLATAVPLAGAAIDAERRSEVRASLATIADALQVYYYDHANFPASLTASGFFGVYLSGGVGGRAIQDPWGAGSQFVYAVNVSTNIAQVHSRGENGVDDGFYNEEWSVAVSGSVPGIQRTHERMRVITEAMVQLLGSGGSLTGTWSTDRAAMGLGSEYQTDGFGTAFTLDPATKTLRSAGPDRAIGTADDLTT